MDRNIIGDYEILKEIGKGPLGTVYLVSHRFIKKQFVIKLLPAAINADIDFYNRFNKNVQQIALLTHPNIVKLHNISESNGEFFFVTDAILNGAQPVTLQDFLVTYNNQLSEKHYIDLFSQIASAIDYAHEKGVVHGMIKPNNVLVKEVSSQPTVYLSDFGLASILGEGYLLTQTFNQVAKSLSVSLDQANIKKGTKEKLHSSFLSTYQFLSPEQKNSNSPSFTSDVYAFGALVYYVLTGMYPEGYFPMPSAVCPHLILNWDHVVKSCLSLDPHARPDSLSRLIENVRTPEKPSFENETSPQKTSFDYTKQVSIEDLTEVPFTETKQDEMSVQREAPSQEPAQQKIYTQEPSYYDPYTQRQQPSWNTQTPQEPQPHSPYNQEPPVQVKKVAPSPVNTPYNFNESLQPQRKQAQQFQSQAQPYNATATLEKNLQPVIQPQEVKKPVYEADPSAVFQTDTHVAPYRPEQKEEKSIEPLLPEMIVIEGGEFYRGSDEGGRDERPMHKVILDSFALDVHPVTNEQFMRFLTLMDGEKDHNNNDIIRLKDSRIHKTGGRYIVESGYHKHPVVGITWYGAVAYAKWVGKRLPTEAEWEVACRSLQNNLMYPTGFEIDKSAANYFSSDTTAVCKYPPNPIGLYDMVGNVYEWCYDWYDYNFYPHSQQEPYNPKGPHQGVYRVLRGGCWKSLKDDLRCSHRHRNNPGATNNMYGFRCASDVS